MKIFLKAFKENPYAILLLLRFYFCRIKNKIIKRLTLSAKGERLKEYLYKVITENYTPQTLTEITDEQAFNPKGLQDEERIKKAIKFFLFLCELS